MYVMGFDIGTSSIKASLVDAATGNLVGLESYPDHEMNIISHHPGWAEQDPEVWWKNVCKVSQKVLDKTKINSNEIKGIGITYQMHGLVLVDKDLHVLRPSIIWCDSRAVDIGKQAFQHLGSEYCLHNYLNSPGNFTASKLKWVKENEPHIYEKVHKILLPGDYINMKFSGEVNTTISGLSEGILWNFKEQRIANRLLEYFDIDPGLIPTIVDTFEETGIISREAANETGLQVGTPITYRAGDQPNNAMALSVLKQGDVGATCGTSGVVYGISKKTTVDSLSRVNGFAHVNYTPKNQAIGTLLCINGAGIGYSWMKNQLAPQGSQFDNMELEASTISVGSEGLVTLPFGNGAERIFQNQDIGAHVLNLNFNIHGRSHLYRSLLEGVAFSFVYGMNVLKNLGLDLQTIKVSNDNMFRSKIFASTISNVMNTNIEVIDTTGAVGAAKAAGVGVGIFSSLKEALQTSKPIRINTPVVNNETYLEAYTNWEKALDTILNKS